MSTITDFNASRLRADLTQGMDYDCALALKQTAEHLKKFIDERILAGDVFNATALSNFNKGVIALGAFPQWYSQGQAWAVLVPAIAVLAGNSVNLIPALSLPSLVAAANKLTGFAYEVDYDAHSSIIQYLRLLQLS